jgi:hypothetical protein
MMGYMINLIMHLAFWILFGGLVGSLIAAFISAKGNLKIYSVVSIGVVVTSAFILVVSNAQFLRSQQLMYLCVSLFCGASWVLLNSKKTGELSK